MSAFCLTRDGRLEDYDGLKIYENTLSFLLSISKGAVTAQSIKIR